VLTEDRIVLMIIQQATPPPCKSYSASLVRISGSTSLKR